LECHVRARRERLGLSQQALAKRVGVSRQAIIAIEAGRTKPSTPLALHLARALACSVEDIFRLPAVGELTVAVSPGLELGGPARAAVGEVAGTWVAHPVLSSARVAADGLLTVAGPVASVRPFASRDELRGNVIIAGCAPLIGALADRVATGAGRARAAWIEASSAKALDLLQRGLVHVAGLHRTGGDNEAAVRARFGERRMLIVGLTRWRQGLVLPPNNPLALGGAQDLLRPGLLVAQREAGAGAYELVRRSIAHLGGDPASLSGPLAAGHEEVAQLVRFGVADVGVAIEGVALAAGLDFIPLTEERFDLVVPEALAQTEPVRRVLDVLDGATFRDDVAHLPGYDAAQSGHVTTVRGAS